MSNSVNLSLDVTKTGIQNPLIKVRQGDGGFETLHTTVTSSGEPLDLQGWTITFMGTTAGNHKIIDANVKVVEAPNGIFDYTPSKAWGMDIGDFKMAYFKFVKGDGSASSANFRVSVIEAVDLTQEEAQNYISVVDTTIAEIRDHLTNSLADVTTSVAATSSAASSLAVSVSSTASSAVSQVNSAASSASSVASSAAAKVSGVAAQVNNLSVGGRNLLLNTGRSFTGVGTNNKGDFNAQGGLYYLAGNKKVSDLYNQYGPSGYLTLSFDWVASGSTISGTFNSEWNSTPWIGIGSIGAISVSPTNTSGHYKITVPLNTSGYSTGAANGIRFRQDNLQGNVTISNLKLEAGNIATDWTPAPEDADSTYVKKSGDSMTGTLTLGGNPLTGGSGTIVGKDGSIELGATSAFIDFHGKNSTLDYTSRIYDDTTFAGAKVANGNSGNATSLWLNTLVLNQNRNFNLDTLNLTVDGTDYDITRNDVYIAFSSRYRITAPTLPSDMTNFNIDLGIIRYRVGPNSSWADMEMTNLWDSSTWRRTKRDGVWQPWVKIANDYNVVHNAGNETVAGDKTFTGNTTANNFVSNGVPVNAVKSTTSTMWYSSTLTAYRNGNVVTIVNNKQDTSTIPDDNTSTETIPLGYRPSTVLFYPVVYGASLKGELQINANGTFTARGAINGQYRVTATYVTSDAWPV